MHQDGYEKVGGESSKICNKIGIRLNPENPFNQMTDKDTLLFNPIYTNYLVKLNKLN